MTAPPAPVESWTLRGPARVGVRRPRPFLRGCMLRRPTDHPVRLATLAPGSINEIQSGDRLDGLRECYAAQGGCPTALVHLSLAADEPSVEVLGEGDPDLGDCLWRVARNWHFAPARGSTHQEVTIVLSCDEP